MNDLDGSLAFSGHVDPNIHKSRVGPNMHKAVRRQASDEVVEVPLPELLEFWANGAAQLWDLMLRGSAV